jgi:hypothetical protein
MGEIRIQHNAMPADGYNYKNNIYIGGKYADVEMTNNYNSVIIGYNGTNTNYKNVLIGSNAQTTSTYATAVGYNAQVTASYEIAIGSNAIVKKRRWNCNRRKCSK